MLLLGSKTLKINVNNPQHHDLVECICCIATHDPEESLYEFTPLINLALHHLSRPQFFLVLSEGRYIATPNNGTEIYKSVQTQVTFFSCNLYDLLLLKLPYNDIVTPISSLDVLIFFW